MPEITGTCLCGEAAYTLPILQQKLNTHICHCNRCRHISGVLCAMTVDLPKSYHPDPHYIDTKLVAYESSPGIYTRYFCRTCGCHMFERDERFGEWRVAHGTLDDPEAVTSIKAHIFVEDTKDGGCSDWITHVNDQKIKRWNAFPKQSSEVPEGWHTSGQTVANKEPGHAHCDCGGVSFYVSHPSAISKETNGPMSDSLLEMPEDKLWWLRAKHTRFLADICLCDDCRLSTGSDMQEWAFIPTANIHLSRDGSVPFLTSFGTLKTYRSSTEASRYFCGTCGATVFWIGDVRPTLIDVSVGLFDAVEGARAESILDFSTERISFREDGMKHAPILTAALEAGFTAWGHSRASN
ncbi:hypothetical protein MBLNU457_4038t1 [Dothideomycetes sp. NU457]